MIDKDGPANSAHQRVFVGCRSGVMNVVDGRTVRIVTVQLIGKEWMQRSSIPRERLSSRTAMGTMAVFNEDTLR